jgi:hypothetical protein
MKTLLPTPKHVELLELCHGYLRGAQLLTTDGPKDIDKDDLARQINLYLNENVMTHGPGCWSWGPTHYMCAFREIKELEAELKEARDK